MSPISVLTSAVPDLGLNPRFGSDAFDGLLGGLLDHTQAAACDAAESLPYTQAGEAAVAAGACAVAGIDAATAVAVGTIAVGFTVGAPISAAAAIACGAVAAAPVLAAATAVSAGGAATLQGLEEAHDVLSPLLPSPQRAAAEGLSGLLDLLDAVRGEARNPLLLPEPLRSMVSTAA